MGTKYKGVDYSYPSSPSAARFGHSKTGCWTVTVYTMDAEGNLKKTKPTFASTDPDEAFAKAATLTEPWGWVWRRYCRHRIAKAEGVSPDEIYQRKPTDPPGIK